MLFTVTIKPIIYLHRSVSPVHFEY